MSAPQDRRSRIGPPLPLLDSATLGPRRSPSGLRHTVSHQKGCGQASSPSIHE